ncbi:ribonuclease R family protein [Almyronema epifaneia]|uniref:Ribonuclease R n=1 Tax=Almyronema epifaneia S1 TaxID=2991925 RepID=A0ABW6IAS2_9CYAN
MDFSIAALLANFNHDKSVTLKTLEKKLNCKAAESTRMLQIAVDALERIGILEKDRGKYRRVEEDGVVEGKLRCSSKGFCFAIQDEEGSEDIYVRESHLNTAWNGDRVLIKVTKEGSRRRSPEGEVKLILERANTSVLARVKKEDEQYQAVPLDDRLLFELELQPNGKPGILQQAVDQLVHIEILRYPLGQEPPKGRVAQILGSDAEAASDLDIVYCKHDLPRSFSEEVLEAARALPTRVRKADMKNRVDLREQMTLTIDGPDAKAIDDALTLQKTDSGHWRLGVHISDISYYVPMGSAIDREAQKRGTSVYLGEEEVPLLPPPLSGTLGSLLAGKDRLALSLIATLDDAGSVVEFEIQPTIVNVDYQLNYQQAQAILERSEAEALERLGIKEKDIKKFEPIYELLDQLFQLSQAVKQQRHARGAFELNLPEESFPTEADSKQKPYVSPKFQYDDEGALGAMVVSAHLPARIVVTEFMLLANHLVADHLKALSVPAIYRVHRTPDPADVQELIKLANNMGLDLQLKDEETVHSRDYQNFVEQFANSKAEKVLTYLLLDSFKPAFYSVHPDTHFGLALEAGYTHFASPMRRYPDLLVHRVLHAVFDQGRDRRSTRSKERVNLHHSSSHGKINWGVLPPDIHHELEDHFSRITVHLTERERLAQDAEADLEGLKKAEFMQAHTGEVFHGLITGVQSYGFFVEIEELLVEGLVHVSSLKDDWYEYRSRQQKLVGRKNRKQYRLGDRVEVQVKSVDYYRQQIDLLAVGGGSEAADDDDDDDLEDGVESAVDETDGYDEDN